MNPSPRAWAARLLCCVALAGAGCDDARVRALDEADAPEATPYVARITVTNQGLSQSVRDALDSGSLVLDAPALELTPTLQMGPMAQDVRISEVTVDAQQDQFNVNLSADNALLLVPVRSGRFDAVRVCRWRVQVRRLEVALRVGRDAAAPRRLVSLAPPQVTFVDPNAEVLGSCTDQTEPTSAQIIEYAREAVGRSAQALGEVSPLETFGVILDGLEFTRQSAFQTRQGVLSLSGSIRPSDPVEIDAQGLSANLSYGVRLDTAAACAPPVDIPSVRLEAARAGIDPAQLERAGADLGFALSWRWIQRFMHVLTRAGFLCKGLSGLGQDPTGGIPRQDVLFEEVNVDASVFGDQVWVSVAPGSLPRLVPNPNDDALELGLDDLALELYAEVFGAVTRVARVIVSANINTRLNARPEALDLDIESITIERVQWESPWMLEQPSQTQVSLWTRRLLLLALDGTLTVPLPFRAGAPLRLLRTQMRNEDVVFYMRSAQVAP